MKKLNCALLLLMLPVLSAWPGQLTALDEELNKAWPANRTINIVFHGHSVPSGYHAAGVVKPFESYPHLFRVMLKERYPNAVINVVTTSIGGEAAIAGAARFDEDVYAQQPDLILIDYAINDRWKDPVEVEIAWRSMIDSTQSAGVPVILITPTGVSGEDLSDPAGLLRQRADLVRYMAASEGTLLADVSEAWLAELASGTPEANLLSQGNHPNLAGHTVAADEIFATFVEATGVILPTPIGVIHATNITAGASAYTSGDGLASLTPYTTNLVVGTFGVGLAQGDNAFFGVVGGGNDNAIRDVDGDPDTMDDRQAMDLTLDSTVGISEIKFRWSRADGPELDDGIVISGFTSDPDASTTTGVGITYTNGSVYLNYSYDSGNVRTFNFQNPTASANQTLRISASDSTQGGAQVAINEISYALASVTEDPEPAVVSMDLSGGTMSVGATNIAASTTVTLQGATDLVASNWVDIAATTGVEQASWEIDTSGSNRFFRVKSE